MESASLRSDYPVVARWDSRNVVAAVRREVHDTFAIKDQRKIVKKCVGPYAATEVGRTRTVSLSVPYTGLGGHASAVRSEKVVKIKL